LCGPKTCVSARQIRLAGIFCRNFLALFYATQEGRRWFVATEGER
jgi:hypothetical protein